MSGQKAHRFADLYLTQWPELASDHGPNFEGGVLLTVSAVTFRTIGQNRRPMASRNRSSRSLQIGQTNIDLHIQVVNSYLRSTSSYGSMRIRHRAWYGYDYQLPDENKPMVLMLGWNGSENIATTIKSTPLKNSTGTDPCRWPGRSRVDYLLIRDFSRIFPRFIAILRSQLHLNRPYKGLLQEWSKSVLSCVSI